MKKFIILVFLFFSSCAGADLLLKGEQIGALWNGKYEEAITGSAYLNVGNKQVDIRNIDIIPALIYNVDQVIEQEKELKVWLVFEGHYLAMKMTRDVLSEAKTIVYLNDPTTVKTEFPTVFKTNILMIRY